MARSVMKIRPRLKKIGKFSTSHKDVMEHRQLADNLALGRVKTKIWAAPELSLTSPYAWFCNELLTQANTRIKIFRSSMS